MKVTMLLADAAQAVGGKLYVLGGGWSIASPGPTPMAIAIKIDVPWDQANQRHNLQLALFDEDGREAMVSTDTGEQAVEFSAEFEVGRPAGLRPGTPLDVPLAISIGPLPLRPNSGYVWRLTIDGQTRDEWRLPFSTRPA